MSNQANLSVLGCPLSLVNGDYIATESTDSFLHSSGKYSLKHTPSGHWVIKESRTGVQVGNSLAPSKSPTQLKWEYLSVKDRTIKHTGSMQCLTSNGEGAAVDLTGEFEEDDPSLLDPVLLTSSFEALVETFRPVPHLPPLAGEDPNICSIKVEISPNKSAEVFLPLSGATELGLQPVSLSHLATLEEAAPYWTSTVASYEQMIQSSAEEAEAREKELCSTIERLKGGAQDSNLRERLFRQASNSWAKQGKGFHIKRDALLNSAVKPPFPLGESVRDDFGTSFLQFETFAADAVTCLEERMGHTEDAAAVLVREVMAPIFEATERFVTERLDARRALLQKEFGVVLDESCTEDSAVRLFWYFSQQTQLLGEVAALTEEDIAALMAGPSTVAGALQQEMRIAAASGEISADQDSLRLPGIVRRLLRLHAVTRLSDPRCYLHPAPGTQVPYRGSHCAEILSPGARTHGRVKEGDTVEVVLPGLYFDDPVSSHKPTFPCLVRRLA